MEDGDVITLQFCSFPSFIGQAIDWFTAGDVGHVDVVLPDGGLMGAQREDGLGGQPTGVQIRPPNYGGMQHVRRVSMPEGDGAKLGLANNFLQAQLGKPYDTLAIVGFVVGRDWRDGGAWFCSELAARFAELAGAFPHQLCAPANKITPQELLLVCSAFGEVIRA